MQSKYCYANKQIAIGGNYKDYLRYAIPLCEKSEKLRHIYIHKCKVCNFIELVLIFDRQQR